MKRPYYSVIFKGAAFLLFLLSVLTAFWSAVGVVYMANDGYYTSGYTFYKSELSESVTRNYANTVFYDYFFLTRQTSLTAEDATRLERYKSEFSKDKTNFFFEVADVSGKVVLSNVDARNTGFQRTYNFSMNVGAAYELYTVSCSVGDPITAQDNYSQPNDIFKLLYTLRYTAIVLLSISALLSLSLFIYLMYAAGHRMERDDIVMTWQHALPLDLLAAILIIAGFLVFTLLRYLDFSWNVDYGLLIILPISVVLTAIAALALILCMNLAVRVKMGKWWQNTVIFRFLKLFVKIARTAGRTGVRLINRLPMIWKAALLIAAYMLANIILTIIVVSSSHSVSGAFLWLFFNFAVFAALCYLMLQLKALKHAGEKLAAGDYIDKIDTKNMLWDIKTHAQNLNNIGSGMSIAVEERLKSERLKTELITNVSHDLKTPLTSIVNYVDLLKKEPIENETAEQYIAVLDRQSTRLKKLTEDLLEATKAATGNVSVNLAHTDLVELLNQSIGEYAERFEACGLEAVFQKNREEAAVLADGRLLWRVIDNLLNNICKYTLTGTRVYIAVDALEAGTKITLMNISRYPLNIAAEELMERFVRGDVSRSTDGSGLGLSIARSLTELQNGRFDLYIDGDLFKTVLTFNTLLS